MPLKCRGGTKRHLAGDTKGPSRDDPVMPTQAAGKALSSAQPPKGGVQGGLPPSPFFTHQRAYSTAAATEVKPENSLDPESLAPGRSRCMTKARPGGSLSALGSHSTGLRGNRAGLSGSGTPARARARVASETARAAGTARGPRGAPEGEGTARGDGAGDGASTVVSSTTAPGAALLMWCGWAALFQHLRESRGRKGSLGAFPEPLTHLRGRAGVRGDAADASDASALRGPTDGRGAARTALAGPRRATTRGPRGAPEGASSS